MYKYLLFTSFVLFLRWLLTHLKLENGLSDVEVQQDRVHDICIFEKKSKLKRWAVH